jgi:hypothetical protein
MPDNTTADFMAQMVDKRLAAISEELKGIATTLETMKATSQKEIQVLDAQLQAIEAARRAVPASPYLSGRWPRRDGDTYGNVKALVSTPETDVADSTPGNLRPSNVSGA